MTLKFVCVHACSCECVRFSILLFKVKELMAPGHTLFQETLRVWDSLEMILFASCSEQQKT